MEGALTNGRAARLHKGPFRGRVGAEGMGHRRRARACNSFVPQPTPPIPTWRPPTPSQEDEALSALRVMSAALGTARLRHLYLSDNALGE